MIRFGIHGKRGLSLPCLRVLLNLLVPTGSSICSDSSIMSSAADWRSPSPAFEGKKVGGVSITIEFWRVWV